jgi:hypothetical protein
MLTRAPAKVRNVAWTDSSRIDPPYTPSAERVLSREQSNHGYFPPQKPAPPTGGTPLKHTPHEPIPDGIAHHAINESTVPAELSEQKSHGTHHLHFRQRIKHFTWTWFTMTVWTCTSEFSEVSFTDAQPDGYWRNRKCHTLQLVETPGRVTKSRTC